MPAHKGTQPPGGSRKGKPNKLNADIKAMILGALNDAGGQSYLARQADENPGPFMALVGKILPKELEVTGKDGKDLIPSEADPSKVALAIWNILVAGAAKLEAEPKD